MSFYENRITVRINEAILEDIISTMEMLDMETKTDYIRSAVIFFNRMHKMGCYEKFSRYLKKTENKNVNNDSLEWSKR